MASLRKRRGTWYARVQWYEKGATRQTEKSVSLRTSSKVTAHERIAEVNKVEDDIKQGMEFSFPWLSDSTTTKIQRFTIHDAVEQWLGQRSSEGIRQSTIRRNRYSLESLMSHIGTSIPLSKVSTSMIDSYRNYCIHKGNKPDGININLRAIKTFFNWCYRRELIEKNLFVDMVSKPKELPLYIPESLYEKLMQLKWLEERFKTAFAFYYETGCRRSEPFLGELHGNWLLIGGDETKQRMDKELSLNATNLERLTSMRTYFNESYGYKLDSWIGNLSKTFLKAMREVDGQNTKYHLHCLRHTFAVRRYLQTRDIYLVKNELGHESVTTTEKYAKFSLRRLENDFPSLVNSTKNTQIWEKGHTFEGHTSNTVPVSSIISGVSTS
jgi:site-specific recombinase XerD